MSANKNEKSKENRGLKELLKLYKVYLTGSGVSVYSRKERCKTMIILRTNSELKATFERLIRTMKEPVDWNGNFVVVGDYLILQGRVRSLFFNFETRKVLTNLIDIPVKEEEVVEIGSQTKIQNALNMVLYAFGKWGMIRGVKVEQDYAQLNRIFVGVLQEISIEPGYSRECFRFYKEGIRLNYEDVIQAAIDAGEDTVQEIPMETEPSRGLWHKLVWKKQTAVFSKSETTFEERQKMRQGNNFYMVGYRCPKCRDHLHMAVFPVGREFRIETSEGGVYLARAYTCGRCHSFYTPRPQKLLSEGDVYLMEFLNDEDAYRDYLELLGAEADRVSNFKFNEFEAVRNRKEHLKIQEQGEDLETLCAHLDQYTDDGLVALEEKMEEGFYPEKNVQRFEHALQQEKKKRAVIKAQNGGRKQAEAFHPAAGRKEQASGDRQAAHVSMPQSGQRVAGGKAVQKQNAGGTKAAALSGGTVSKASQADGKKSLEKKTPEKEIPAPRRESAKKRYEAKCRLLDRLSLSQVSQLHKELSSDANLYDTEKEPFLKEIQKKEQQLTRAYVKDMAESCNSQNYAGICHAIEEIEKTGLPEKEKEAVLKPLYTKKNQKAQSEAEELLKKMPKQLDMKQYRGCMERLKGYPEADISAYDEYLNEKRRQAEKQEIANIISRAKTTERKGITDLMERLKEQDFEREILAPYLKKLEDDLRILDENAIAEICGNPAQMTIAENMEAYRKLEEGVFLPELKTNALEMMKKRLAKLKTDECELLVHRLSDGLDGRINKNDRHHYYPARKVLTKEAKPEEYEVIQYALDTYGTSRGEFEYPILVVDTSRDRSGKEGMILTPEHVFYRTMLNAYVVAIGDIRKLQSQTGLFRSGLFLELNNGEQIKIPYAVDKKELTAWGNCLEEFIHYLQEKPDSRKVTYLAREKHETICCFRCGYSYKGGNVCPKCGYKMNE